MNDIDLPPSWRDTLSETLASPALQKLQAFLEAEQQAGKRIFPPRENWFAALDLTPLDQVRVVILGQDPYHREGQAHGLSFSVRPGTTLPPSLQNVYKEMETDLAIPRASHGFLEHWARQGVLLLNTILTVEEGCPLAHKGRGWEPFTDAVIRLVNAKAEPVVFMLWGNPAKEKAALVDSVASGGRHFVLTAFHPSGLSASRGFFRCRHFSQANAFLAAHGRGTIDWALPEIRDVQ